MIRFCLCFALLTLSACATSAPISAPPIAHVDTTAAYDQTKTASLWNQEPQSLFGNRRARNVGDILTVIVAVDENAEFQNSLQRSRENNEDFSVNNLFGIPEWANGTLPEGATLTPAVSVTRSAEATGNGAVQRQERITLRLAAQVVGKQPNGHLVVMGTQRIRVNNEVRDLKLTGVVRPEDITRDNTITHDKVAAADIVYTGQGQVSQQTRPRAGSRILDLIVPF